MSITVSIESAATSMNVTSIESTLERPLENEKTSLSISAQGRFHAVPPFFPIIANRLDPDVIIRRSGSGDQPESL